MVSMQRRSLFRLSLFAAALGLVVALLAAGAQDTPRRGRKYKAPPPSARIEVTVLRDVNGKPIENAAVVFHPLEGGKEKGSMELKTNEDGKTILDVLPIGDTVRLQVIASGFQTFGDEYKIDKPEMAIEIKMKRPGEQYSIYKPHDAGQVGGKSPDADKTAAPAKDAAPTQGATPPPATDKPADAQPSQPQSK
jgi:5-hydroxyisourate hydrolase-like protein (transthyretin family)